LLGAKITWLIGFDATDSEQSITRHGIQRINGLKKKGPQDAALCYLQIFCHKRASVASLIDNIIKEKIAS